VVDGEVEGDVDGEVEGEVEGDVEGDVEGELDGELGVPKPLHGTPLNAKFTGALFVPEYVA